MLNFPFKRLITYILLPGQLLASCGKTGHLHIDRSSTSSRLDMKSEEPISKRPRFIRQQENREHQSVLLILPPSSAAQETSCDLDRLIAQENSNIKIDSNQRRIICRFFKLARLSVQESDRKILVPRK